MNVRIVSKLNAQKSKAACTFYKKSLQLLEQLGYVSPENPGISLCTVRSDYKHLLRMSDVYSMVYVETLQQINLSCD